MASSYNLHVLCKSCHLAGSSWQLLVADDEMWNTVFNLIFNRDTATTVTLSLDVHHGSIRYEIPNPNLLDDFELLELSTLVEVSE